MVVVITFAGTRVVLIAIALASTKGCYCSEWKRRGNTDQEVAFKLEEYVFNRSVPRFYHGNQLSTAADK